MYNGLIFRDAHARNFRVSSSICRNVLKHALLFSVSDASAHTMRFLICEMLFYSHILYKADKRLLNDFCYPEKRSFLKSSVYRNSTSWVSHFLQFLVNLETSLKSTCNDPSTLFRLMILIDASIRKRCLY